MQWICQRRRRCSGYVREEEDAMDMSEKKKMQWICQRRRRRCSGYVREKEDAMDMSEKKKMQWICQRRSERLDIAG